MSYISNLRKSIGHNPIISVGSTVLVFNNKNEILLNLRTDTKNWGIPGGGKELYETLEECAIRETEEETGRKNHLLLDRPSYKLEYTTPRGEEVENYMFISIDDGDTDKEIPDELKESLVWVDINDVDNKLSYPDLIEMWNTLKDDVLKLL